VEAVLKREFALFTPPTIATCHLGFSWAILEVDPNLGSMVMGLTADEF
jgi:hypothetical protein